MLIQLRDEEEDGKLVWIVKFSYDEKLKDYLKQIIPSHQRRWDPSKKVWVIIADQSLEQSVIYFLDYAQKAGHKVNDARKFDYSKKEKARQEQRRQYEEQARKARESWERLQEEARRAKERARQTYTPPRNSYSENWADALFRAVGPEREKSVFKALTKVLHPDAETGSHELMQELNLAWDKRKK